MGDEKVLTGPGDNTPGLDSAAWLKLGQIAQATHQSLQSQAPQPQAPVAASVPGQSQSLLAALAAETVNTFKRDWQRFWHPLQSLRAWWAQVTQALTPIQDRGSARDGGQSPNTPTPPDKGSGSRGPTLDQTWTQVRDQLFEAAQNPTADPQKVADSIVSAIPADHRTAMAERLQWLSEMAQTTAKSLQAAETQAAAKSADPSERAPLGEPPPERTFEPPLPDNVRLLKTKPPERQVPKQPLPETPQVARPQTKKAEDRTRAKSKAR